VSALTDRLERLQQDDPMTSKNAYESAVTQLPRSESDMEAAWVADSAALVRLRLRVAAGKFGSTNT
jgi:hypothetical protein